MENIAAGDALRTHTQKIHDLTFHMEDVVPSVTLRYVFASSSATLTLRAFTPESLTQIVWIVGGPPSHRYL